MSKSNGLVRFGVYKVIDLIERREKQLETWIKETRLDNTKSTLETKKGELGRIKQFIISELLDGQYKNKKQLTKPTFF